MTSFVKLRIAFVEKVCYQIFDQKSHSELSSWSSLSILAGNKTERLLSAVAECSNSAKYFASFTNCFYQKVLKNFFPFRPHVQKLESPSEFE